MDWIPTAQEWTAVWTFGLFATAFVSAILAFRQVNQARDLRRLEYQGYVYIYPELTRRRSFIDLVLVIENVGRMIAENVSLFEEDLETLADRIEERYGSLPSKVSRFSLT